MSFDLKDATFITENWVATEITLKTKKKYTCEEAFNLIADGIFTHSESGEKLVIPVFWYKDDVFKLRFAPTKEGLWQYKTICNDDESLNSEGTVFSIKYMGEYEVYKRGFVKTDGCKYFVYNDGTPFFYLGDTHWSMFTEEFDSPGDRVGNINCDSHFKYIVDKRIKQGFNVYQSEPIGAPFELYNGICENTMDAFIQADRYFKYIADKGMTHTNAQFFFVADMHHIMNDKKYIEALSRHWVARWGAYPVMWTLAQECDNDFYYESFSEGGQTEKWWNHETNPWIDVAVYVHKYDAYHHPLTGHQEGATNTTVTGKGAINKKKSFDGKSVFLNKEISEKTGHDWYGAQWKPNFTDMIYNESAEDYWGSDKVSINYEGRYVNLWTDDFGGRCQGWMSYLCGFFGYGYGAQDMWYYKSTYDINTDTVRREGRSTVYAKDKQIFWSEALELPSGYHMGYMRKFFESFSWWRLVPQFDNGRYFIKDEGANFSCAAIENEKLVIYFYNGDDKTGKIINLDKNASYEICWYNPRTDEYSKIAIIQDMEEFILPSKPDNLDWVAVATKK